MPHRRHARQRPCDGGVKVSQNLSELLAELKERVRRLEDRDRIFDSAGSIKATSISGVPVHAHDGGAAGGPLLQPRRLKLPAPMLLTIAGGIVSVAQSHHRIDTEAAAASDDLDTVNGLEANMLYVLRPAAGMRTVVIKHGTGNILNWNNADYALDDVQDWVWGISPDGAMLYVLGDSQGGDAQFLTLAAHAGLTSERIFTPRNNAFGTDGGAGAAYTLDSWRKGADIASAATLTPGTDGDYFHVTGTTDISGISASAYKTAVLANSPGGYWRLGESSGNAADSSGNGNTATAIGGLTYSVAGALASDPDTAVTFNGTTGYFSAADAASIDPGDTFTLEAWVKKAADGVWMTIASKGTGAFFLGINSSNQLDFAKQGTNPHVAVSVPTITGTGWHHVAATKSGGTVHLYIDGADVPFTLNNATMVTNASALEIGRDAAGAGTYWNGSLDEVAVYPTALSAATILDHYNKGVGGLLGTGGRLLLEFDGALTLTHSANLILQGSANYKTAASDVLEFVYEGAKVWREANRHTALRTKGTASIASGNTSVTVTHGAGVTPAAQDIIVTPSNNPTNDPGDIWVDTIGATTFKVNCRADPGASGLNFGWSVLRV